MLFSWNHSIMGPRKVVATFIGVVLLSGFTSFCVCVSMTDTLFFTHLWLPVLAIHCAMAFIILYIHSREDKKRMEPSHSGKPLCIMFMAFSIGVSILITTIVISLCIDPYCTQIRSPSMDPIIVYTILAVFEYFHLCIFFDFCFIKFAGTRNLLYRLSVSFPAMLHFTTCVLSSFVLWLYPITAYLATQYDVVYLPTMLYIFLYLFSINGLYNSLWTHWSYVHVNMSNVPTQMNNNTASTTTQRPQFPLLNDEQKQQRDSFNSNTHQAMTRCDSKQYIIRNPKLDGDCLRICQITDPHIGPLMNVSRLQRICREIVHKDPDLVLLTGDYYTGEANLDGLLLKALEPLKPIAFKCFACLGNHDMESNDVYNRTLIELRALGITVLRNSSIVYDKLPIGPIQIIGFDWIWHGEKDRRQRHRNILAQNPCPKECDHRRIVLLHDPGGFTHFEDDERIVVFSGHTHGGVFGMLSCGFQWTLFRQFLQRADHGLWQNGSNKLYIHRGQGSRALYGNFVLRCGVPTENSIVHIQW
eukprot:770498_1